MIRFPELPSALVIRRSPGDRRRGVRRAQSEANSGASCLCVGAERNRDHVWGQSNDRASAKGEIASIELALGKIRFDLDRKATIAFFQAGK